MFSEFARDRHCVVAVRTCHPYRLDHIDDPDIRPKPAGLYNKTHKGRPGDPRNGLVVLTDDPLDCDTNKFPDGTFETERDTGAILCQGLAFCGDIDIHGVYQGNTKVPASAWLRPLNRRMRRLVDRSQLALASQLVPGVEGTEHDVRTYDVIQHGAHDEWPERNDAEYHEGKNMGPIPGVLVFSPDGSFQHAATVSDYLQLVPAAHAQYTDAAFGRGFAREPGRGNVSKAMLHQRPTPPSGPKGTSGRRAP